MIVMFPRVFSKSRRLPLGLVIASSLMQAVLAIVIAFSMRDMFATFSQSPSQLSDLPWKAIVTILVSSFGILLLRVLEKYSAEYAAQMFVKELRLALYNCISRMPNESLRQHKSGSLQIRFVGDLSAIKGWVAIAIPRLITAICLLPALLYLLYSVHPILSVMGSVMVFTSILVMHLIAPLLRGYHKKLRHGRGNLASYIAMRLTDANYLRVLGMRKKITSQINKRSDKIRDAAMSKVLMINSFKSIPEFVLQLLALCGLSIALLLGMSAAEGAIVLAIMAIFQQPLQGLAGFWDKRHAYSVSRRKCVQILNSHSMTAGKKSPFNQQCDLSLGFQNVTFQNITLPELDARAGQVIEISGAAASGKSLYLNTIVGLSQPATGSIQFNGSNLNQLPESVRNKAIYFQASQIAIFASTIKSALLLGVNHSVTTQQLLEVIEQVGLTQTIEKLGGLNARVAEGARNLSETDISRIALVRLLLTKAKYVLIDDYERFRDLVSFDVIRELMREKSRIILYSTQSSKSGLTVKTISSRRQEYDDNKFNTSGLVYSVS